MAGLDDIYDPNTVARQSGRKTLADLIFQAVKTVLLDTHTCLPAEITVVRSTSEVDIQPLLKRKFANGDLVSLPVIQNVPVHIIRGKDYSIKVPIVVGDTGMAIFAERSLDVWGVSGGLVDPADTRMHDLSDAIFVPGLYPFSDPAPVGSSASAATDMVLTNGDAQLYLQKAGTFLAKNSTNELFLLIDQLFQVVEDMNTQLALTTVNTIFGLSPLNNAAQFTTFEGEIANLKTMWETLKGS